MNDLDTLNTTRALIRTIQIGVLLGLVGYLLLSLSPL
jgi:hypothetical protein